MKKILVLGVFVFIILPLTRFSVNEFEGKKPQISIKLPSLYLNRSYDMSVSASDKGTGLRNVRVSIVQNGKEKVLLNKKYPLKRYKGIFLGSGIFKALFKIPVEPWKYGMIDGPAVFRISASDYSWRGWNNGNRTDKEIKLVIDTKAPEIEILTKRHNITRGGAGLVIYRLFEDGLRSGVMVGKNFFPGYSGAFDDKNVYMSFVALSYKQGPGTKIVVEAQDPAGNISKKGFYHYIKDRKFKHDVINISDNFLTRKMPDFALGAKEASFASSKKSLLKKFLYINRILRKQNVVTVLKPVVNTEHKILWKGAFKRLPGSANRAGFADHRVYKYHGKEIDREVHLGVDLASIANARVPAANSGKVISTEKVGIFGNTVVIDHGFGLSSIYSHLSHISVKKGEMVKKGEIIGRTGSTGLAGGDHLHFGVAVNTVFVNPVEWWDRKWIQNNILSKINNVKEELAGGEGIK